jgi:hypothetical protein
MGVYIDCITTTGRAVVGMAVIRSCLGFDVQPIGLLSKLGFGQHNPGTYLA